MEPYEPPVNKPRYKFLKFTLGAAGASAAALLAYKLFWQQGVKETGEKIKLLSPDGQIIEIDKAYVKEPPELPHNFTSPEESRKGIPGKKFVMVIDLARCKNLRKCYDACSHIHHLSADKDWIKVLKMEGGDKETPYWQPTTCFHCDDPPCVKVCPVDATFKREDGLVLIDNQRCIGCRFCMVACPYSARVFDWRHPELSAEVEALPYSPETSLPSKIGTVSKCDFCANYSREGNLPPCVTACPNNTIYYGDENEDTVSNGAETVRFSELIKERSGYRFMEELGTKPRVYYLPPVTRRFPFEEDKFSKEDYNNYPDKI